MKRANVALSGAIPIVSAGAKNNPKKYFEFFKKLLIAADLCSIVYMISLGMTIKEEIQKELLRRGWSHYRLVKEVEGKVPPRTVYAYLSGERDLSSERVSIILQALDLRVTCKPKRGKSPRREVV